MGVIMPVVRYGSESGIKTKEIIHMIKCIASDMDGTLLTGNSMISEKNKQAIKLAQDKGVEFIVATGRSYQEAQFALLNAKIDCPVICVNGAEVRSSAGEILASQPLAQEKAVEVASILANHHVYFEVYTEKGTFTNDLEQAVSVMIDVFTSANHHFTKDEVETFAKERVNSGFVQFVQDYNEIFAENKIYKLLAFSADLAELANAREELVGLTGLAVSSSGDGNLEITSITAQKGIALAEYVKQKGISLIETMAIGDNDNDLSMLNIVGRSVAMGNAADHVKAQSDLVTLTNDEDGVAKAIIEALD